MVNRIDRIMTIARRMAQWANALKYEDLPETTIHEVKRRVIDSVAAALGGYRSHTVRVARAKAMAASDAPPAATVWGSRHYCPPDLAAFANGAMLRYLDYNDTYISLETTHPSGNIPAAVAVTQTAGKTGKDLILAIVVGYEIQCRLCDAASLHLQGWDHVTYGALSTTLLAARLWNLTEDQTEHALGIAGVCNIATRQSRTGNIGDWGACAFANAGRNGVFAADLARRGLTGPCEIFEGPGGLMRQLGIPGIKDLILGGDGSFMVDKTHLKWWPAEYPSQSMIDAVLQLRPQVEGKEIKEVVLKTCELTASSIAAEPNKRRPTTRETADHSMYYCCAAALLDGAVTPQTFSQERLSDPEILRLIDKIMIVDDPELTKAYPHAVPADVAITCVDGTTVRKRVDFPRGHTDNPLSDDDVTAKMHRMAEDVLTEESTATVLDHVWNLDSLTDVTPIFTQKGIEKKKVPG